MSVRNKLITIVAACLVPAGVTAILRSREATRDLLDSIEERVKASNASFEQEISEDQANTLIGAKMVANDLAIRDALVEGDFPEVKKALALLGRVYSDTIVLVAETDGKQVVASTDVGKVPAVLDDVAFAPAFGSIDVMAIAEIEGSKPAKGAPKSAWYLVSATAISRHSTIVGVAAILTPLDAEYLAHVEKKIGADVAVSINGTLVASCPDHPDPGLRSDKGSIVSKQKGGKEYALSTFTPAALAGSNVSVEITTSREVTKLVSESHADLYRSIGLLLIMKAVVLVGAIWTARKITRAVHALRDATQSVARGVYVRVAGVKTGDELEVLADDFNGMVGSLEERDRLRSGFARFLSNEAVEKVLAPAEAGKPRSVTATVLVADLRGFSALASKLKPEEAFDVLNTHLEAIVEAIFKHEGTIEKFVGDSVIAVFGMLQPKPEDAANAVAAAREIRKNLAALDARLAPRGIAPLPAGIGLHTGTLLVGGIGHPRMQNVGVYGDAVAVASRLESMTRQTGSDVLLSAETAAAAGVKADRVSALELRGRTIEVLTLS